MKNFACAVMFVFAFCVLSAVPCLANNDDVKVAYVLPGYKFFMHGEHEVTVGAIGCAQMEGSTIHVCGDNLQLIFLPLRIMSDVKLTNVRLTQYDTDSDEHQLVANVTISNKGEVTGIKQTNPWNGRTLIIEAKVESPAKAHSGREQHLALTGFPMVKNSKGVISLLRPDRNFRTNKINLTF